MSHALLPRTLSSLFLTLAATYALAQTSVTGTVTEPDGDPVIGALVTLAGEVGEERSTLTDADGVFAFDDVDDRDYQLTVSALGLAAGPQPVRPSATALAIETRVVETELGAVEVIGRRRRDYQSEYSYSATKTAIRNELLPQSLNTVTKELIDDRQAFELQDAVKTVSSVAPTGLYNHFAIRGITANEDGQVINGLRTRSFYFLQPLTANIERVEVLKGPATVTFASADPGGTVNVVTKKPLDVARKEVSLSVGSFSTLRGAVDFTGPLNEDKTLLYRLNAAYQENRSYRDLIDNRSLQLTPSLTYRPNDRTSVNTEVILNDMTGYLDRGQPIFGEDAGQVDLTSTPISENLGEPNDFLNEDQFIWTTTLSHRLTDAISFTAVYMKQTWEEDLVEHRSIGAFATDLEGNTIPSLVQRRYIQRKQFWDTDNVNAYFNFDFDLGATSHNLLVGYDLQSWDKERGSGQNQARGFLLEDGTATRRFDSDNADAYQTIEIDGQTLPRPNVPYYNLASPNYALANPQDYVINSRFAVPATRTSTNAAYVQETLEFGKFTALLSLRAEFFRDITNVDSPNEAEFDNTAIIPRLGLTYSVNDDLNVYATYLEGYQPQSNTVALMPSTGNFFWASQSAAQFDPLISDLKEVGFKASLGGNRFNWTGAVYEINQENILISANDPDEPDRLTQRGADRSRGFETDITGYITPDWQVVASYGFTDAEIIADDDETLVGSQKENAPRHSGAFWTRYDFQPGTYGRFGLGAGLTAQGARVPWFTRAFEIPGYAVADVAAYYTARSGKASVSLLVGNLFDQTYHLGAQTLTRLFPGAPRNVMLTTAFRF